MLIMLQHWPSGMLNIDPGKDDQAMVLLKSWAVIRRAAGMVADGEKRTSYVVSGREGRRPRTPTVATRGMCRCASWISSTAAPCSSTAMTLGLEGGMLVACGWVMEMRRVVGGWTQAIRANLVKETSLVTS